MNYQFVALRPIEEAKKTFIEYRTNQSHLEKEYAPLYFVSTPQAYEIPSKSNEGYTISTWTDFTPTVLAVCDYVLLVIPKDDGTSYVYALQQKELLDLVKDTVVMNDKPITHYILETPQEDIIQAILKRATFIKKAK